MSNPNNSPSDELLNILRSLNNVDPRKEYLLRGLPNDIQEMFNNEPANNKAPDDNHREIPWQFWYNNSLSEFKSEKEKEYRTTLYALHYVPKLKDGNIQYDTNSEKGTQEQASKHVKEEFYKSISNAYLPQNLNPLSNPQLEERNKGVLNEQGKIDYEIPTLKMLFESEKANIAAITMQADQELNKFLLDFLVKIITIVREGITLCKSIDAYCGVKGSDNDYNIVELLNRSMPLARKKHNMDDKSYKHVTPGSFIVTRDTLSIDGIKSLNFREKVQLMNCFWNCTSHKLKGNNNSDHSNIYEQIQGNRDCKDSYLKIRTKDKTAPILNMVYEKVDKNKNYILQELRNTKNFSKFLGNIETFKGRIDKNKKENEKRLKNRKIPDDHTIPSGRYPLCYDYNETKKIWNPVVRNLDRNTESHLFPVVINDDFLINIQKIFQDYLNNQKLIQELTSIKMSDNEKIYMKEYETDETKRVQIDKGYIYWTTGFSLAKLNLDGILSYNMIRQAEIANEPENIQRLENNKDNNRYKYVKSGLSGSTWKYLQLAYFMGANSNEKKEYLDRMYHVAIAFLVGCYHHSWYEVTRSALDFRKELEKDLTGIYYSGDDLKLNIDDSFWILNRKSKLWDDSNTSLHASTRKYLKKLFLSEAASGKNTEKDYLSHTKYLHFYRKFVHPLIPLTKEHGNIEDLMKSVNKKIKVGPYRESGRTRRRSQLLKDYVTDGGKGKKTRKRQSGRRTRRTPRYSGGKKTRKRKSKFPYISRGGGLI